MADTKLNKSTQLPTVNYQDVVGLVQGHAVTNVHDDYFPHRSTIKFTGSAVRSITDDELNNVTTVDIVGGGGGSGVVTVNVDVNESGDTATDTQVLDISQVIADNQLLSLLSMQITLRSNNLDPEETTVFKVYQNTVLVQELELAGSRTEVYRLPNSATITMSVLGSYTYLLSVTAQKLGG